MVCIVLDIESNESLCDSECDCKFEGGLLCGPEVIEDDVESNVKECTGEVSRCSKFTASADDFEYFPLDFAFEIRVENVAVGLDKDLDEMRCGLKVIFQISIFQTYLKRRMRAIEKTVAQSMNIQSAAYVTIANRSNSIVAVQKTYNK